jgi:SAM-dependent methyltransferase
MSSERFDRDHWERRWTEALREHPDRIAGRPPNAHLLTETADLRPGRALDAGCGHGAEALWLASRGWQVTAVDYSVSALDIARSRAQAVGTDVAERIEWTEGDLATWTPSPGHYDLVISLYVHVQGSVAEMVRRLGAGVAPGGTLLLVGHRPVDPATGAPTPAAGQVQVSVDAAVGALDPRDWRIEAAEERPRAAAGTGVDAVVRAVSRCSG